MEFLLLGEMELWAAGRQLDVGVPRQQIVLTALAVEVGRPIAIETLIDRVWDDSPPAAARNVLYSHLSRIRRILREASVLSGEVSARIDRRHAGYVLDVDPDLVDVHRFRRLADQGCDPRGSDPSRAAAFEAALALWRGLPLAGLPGKWISRIRDSWQRQRLDTVVHWAQAELRLGRPGAVIALLPDLVSEYPLVEPLEGLLMRALRMAGRDAEALHRYAAVRQRLAVELGTNPGSELRRLHETILRGEPTPSSQADQVVRPAQLPLDVHGFTGREQELRTFDDLLPSTAAVVVVVSGPAGVGKTTLALHWAHQVRDRFPGGQLYIDLSGYAHGPPLRPEQVLSQFLRALGVRPEHVPAELAAAAALYRSVVADRRVLVVLDNASSADHVRPLLPANPDCLVVITSRNRLDGLVALGGARRVALDVLPLQDAVALLATTLGRDRVAAESEAAAEFARLCACLPLALRIAASHLARYPGRRIAEHVAALRHSDLFAALQVDGDEQAAVHAAFDLSYGALKPEGQFVFRHLGLMPGADIEVAAVAALIDQPQDQAGRLLAQLHATHLIEEPVLGRFSCHDLLRRYAKERGEHEDSEQERAAAFDRLIRFYLRTTNAAAEHLYPQLLRLTPLPDPVSGIFASSAEALAWLDCERPNLVAAVQAAHAGGRSDLAWLLADALRGYFNLRRHMSCWFAVARTAVAAAEHHPMPQASARMSLGRAYQCVARYPEAVEQYTAAGELCRKVGWDRGAAAALNNLGIIDQQLGHWDRAVRRLTESLALNIQAGERYAQANVLLNLAGVDMIRGHVDLAADRCQQALAIAVETDMRPSAGCALDYLGLTAHLHGQLDDALDYCTRSLAIYQDIGACGDNGEIYVHIADILRDSGRYAEALENARKALALSVDSGDLYAEANACNAVGAVHNVLGEHGEAVNQHEHALRIARTAGSLYAECHALAGMARGQLNIGRHDEALDNARRALAVAEGAGHQPMMLHALTTVAIVHLSSGTRDQAIDTAKRALTIARHGGYRLIEERVRHLVALDNH